MKRLIRGLEDVFTAVAFTDAGELQKAVDCLVRPYASACCEALPQVHPQQYIPLVPEGDP